MSEYKLCEKCGWDGSKLRTDAYQFTITSLDDPKLADLRKETKRHNKAMRALARQTGYEYYAERLKRVRIMPRGPRAVHAAADYPNHSRGGAYDSYLPMRYGTHFDVYIQRDDKIYELLNELRTGLRPGDRAALKKFEREEWNLQAKHNKMMEDRGLYKYAGSWMTRERAANCFERDGMPKFFVERIRNG